MKPKNFPKRKLQRQLRAAGESLSTEKNQEALRQARAIRTKKPRGSK